MLCGVVTVAG